jgi:hypothetical protein
LGLETLLNYPHAFKLGWSSNFIVENTQSADKGISYCYLQWQATGEDLIVSDQVHGSLPEETSTQSKPAFLCGLEKYALLKKEQISITLWVT